MTRRGFLVSLVVGLVAGATGGLFTTGRAASGSLSAELMNLLSPKERQVLALRARGWNNAQISHELLLSPFAVSVFVQNGLEKLKMHSRLEAS